MPKHMVQFHTMGDRGGEYNIAVTTDPDATDEQIINTAIAKANGPLRKLNRGGYDIGVADDPTVHRGPR
ncbi:hypothetical protein [Kitasatospora sp. NBC_01302]|uniref:hypothetical protein n=1 Tax=Kitasatospora sp. NBC_01302 TaxID=2903575 RepID=UPI002E0DC3E9|nr:hypothetical protein OG294_14205 [Kitasatospora sp. NBC_01302]